MAPPGIVEALDVLKDGSYRLPPGWPALPSDHFCLQGFEETLKGSHRLAPQLQILTLRACGGGNEDIIRHG